MTDVLGRNYVEAWRIINFQKFDYSAILSSSRVAEVYIKFYILFISSKPYYTMYSHKPVTLWGYSLISSCLQQFPSRFSSCARGIPTIFLWLSIKVIFFPIFSKASPFPTCQFSLFPASFRWKVILYFQVISSYVRKLSSIDCHKDWYTITVQSAFHCW